MSKATLDYPFIRYPRALIDNPVFFNISLEARTVLAMILDRTELSKINSDRFSDKNGDVFVVLTIEEIRKKSHCSSEKAIRIFRELENAGMIKRYRRTRSTPYRIYLTDAFYDVVKSDFTKSENPTSRGRETRCPEFGKPEDIYNEYSNNNISNNKSSIIVTDDEIREQIEYDCLYCEDYAGMLDEIVMIISDVLNGTSPTVRIGKDDMPREIVVRRFRMLEGEHIMSILWQLGRNKTKIRNMKAYLIMKLYNEVEAGECELTAALAMLYPES